MKSITVEQYHEDAVYWAIWANENEGLVVRDDITDEPVFILSNGSCEICERGMSEVERADFISKKTFKENTVRALMEQAGGKAK